MRDTPFHTIPVPVNLRDPDFQAEFRTLATRLNPVLIIVDTLHRCTPGTDENTSRDIGEIVAFAQTLQYEHRATVLFLHHPPKNDPAGRGRGSSTLYYAADTEISAVMEGEENPDSTKMVTFKVKKQKDDQKISFTLMNRIVELRNDAGDLMAYASGRPIRSCILVEATEDEQAEAGGQQKREGRLLKYISNNPNCTKTSVCTFLGGDKRDVLQGIEDLVTKGLVVVTPKGNSHLLSVAGRLPGV